MMFEHHVTCRRCKQTTVLALDESEYEAWRAGKLIQYAMPRLTANERELLISNTCGDCFDRLFKEED